MAQPYPKWRYSEGESKIVFTEAEAETLGDGWYDTPTELEAAQTISIEASKPDIDKIRAALDEKGIPYDKRWGLAKLSELLDD